MSKVLKPLPYIESTVPGGPFSGINDDIMTDEDLYGLTRICAFSTLPPGDGISSKESI